MILITPVRDGAHKIEFSCSATDFECAVEPNASRSTIRVPFEAQQNPSND